jgi:hypothetical protein
MSNDRIPEIKMATAMFEVANTTECYPHDNEDINGTNCYYESQNADAELTSRIDDVPTSTDTGSAKWRPPDRK